MDMADDELLTAFEDRSLPFGFWNHQAHVRVAFQYASRYGLDEAIDQMRTGLRSYNAAHQIPDGPERGYNETTTQAFMRLIRAAIEKSGPFDDSDAFCLYRPELLDRRVLLCYYTRDRILNPTAKAIFIEPDITPLNHIGLVYPEFGEQTVGADYVLRPGGYGVISDGSQNIAVVITPSGCFLPGGGQEAGESAFAALHREALEECGLTIRIETPLGMADEFVFAQDENRHFCKRCTFFAAKAMKFGPSSEADHLLSWVPVEDAIDKLSHGSQRWAMRKFCNDQHSGEPSP